MWHSVTSTFVSRGRRGAWSRPPSFCVAGVALVALGWLWCHTPSLSHTIFHTLSHTPSLTHPLSRLFRTPAIFVTTSFTHYLSHTLFHTQLCHTPSLTHHLSHTTLSPTIFDTPSFTLCHPPSFTHGFVTHHLSHIIFDTPSFTHPLSRGREVVLRPAVRPSNPAYIPTPDADDTWGEWNNSHYPDDNHHNNARPNSPAGPPPPEPSTNPPLPPAAPLGAVAFRVPDGDSENSEVTDAFSISKFDSNDIDLSEMVEAANDPLRVRCLTELGPDYTISLRQSLNQSNMQLFNQFVDEMFLQLAQPYRNVNNQRIFIRASQATVKNIARAFAQSRLLDIELAKQTKAFYIEPENLLTITVPTGLPKKPIYRGEHMGTYLIYHKTSWETVAKILAEDCIRPATWTKNEAGYPTQYPCYGFFGMSCEIPDIDVLPGYAVKLCTSQLYRIGKGQNPSGLLAICRSPKCMRALSGGNDQIQCLCNLQGISKGKDNATAMNSSAASICYVASTHSVYPGLITPQAAETNPSTAAAPNEPPADHERPELPDSTADTPAPSDPPPDDSRATTSHHETTAHATRDHARRHWHDNPSWDGSTYKPSRPPFLLS